MTVFEVCARLVKCAGWYKTWKCDEDMQADADAMLEAVRLLRPLLKQEAS